VSTSSEEAASAPTGLQPSAASGAIMDWLTVAAVHPLRVMPAHPQDVQSRTWTSDRLEDEMGCLFALFAGVFPRLAVLILWIARPERIDAAFSTFLWPLLGIIFLPFATLIYVLLYTPGRGLSGWDWFWVVLAALLDIGHWGASATQRNQIPGRRASEA
jgi:hypothetical protein